MGINSLMSLVGKNLKMFFRSKFSATAVILIPLLIIILAGFAFNSSELSGVYIGVYSSGYTDFTNNVINDFELDGFLINRYESNESCIKSVKHTESQICVLFPRGLSPDSTDEEIIFHVDYSRVNLADNLINEIQKRVLVKTSAVGEEMAQNLIDSLENTEQSLPQSKTKIDNAIADVKENKDKNSDLEFPTADIESAIADLEDAKDDINDSETGLISSIEDIILKLTDIKLAGESLSSNIDDISSNQDSVINNLNSASSDINDIIVSLSSGKDISAGNIISPIKTKIEAINSKSTNKDYIIPIILSLIALFGAILLSSTFVLKEKKTKAFFRNFMAPTKNITFILSTYITCLAVIAIQFLLILIGARYILKMDVIPILLPLIAVLFITLSAFITIGMFMGYLFRSEETIIFSSMIIAALLMFFSNVILPLENISPGLIKFFKFNPLVISNLALKKVILFGFGFGDIWVELLTLFGFFTVFFILNCIFRSLTKRVL